MQCGRGKINMGKRKSSSVAWGFLLRLGSTWNDRVVGFNIQHDIKGLLWRCKAKNSSDFVIKRWTRCKNVAFDEFLVNDLWPVCVSTAPCSFRAARWPKWWSAALQWRTYGSAQAKTASLSRYLKKKVKVSIPTSRYDYLLQWKNKPPDSRKSAFLLSQSSHIEIFRPGFSIVGFLSQLDSCCFSKSPQRTMFTRGTF